MISFSNHTGTHIDFPRHFSKEGKILNDYPADFWFFKNPYILEKDAAQDEIINFSNELIASIHEKTDILILKTGFQQYRDQKLYWNNNPGLDPSLAGKLKSRCKTLKVIGFDLISLSSYQNRDIGREAHCQFLVNHDILIIEDMNLQDVSSNIYEIICLPLLLESADGSPITVIGLKNE